MGDEPKGLRGLLVRAYHKIVEDGAGYLAVVLWGVLVNWIWPRTVEIRQLALERPSTAVVIAILLVFSLYGIADASLKFWRWVKRRHGSATPGTRAGAEVPTIPSRRAPTYEDWTSGFLKAYGLRARWRWVSRGRVDAVAALCPQCFAEMTPVPIQGGLPGLYTKTRIRCPHGHYDRDFPDLEALFPKRLEAEINRMKDSGEWKASLREEREREARI